MSRSLPIIGLTGGIGSGKSTVASILQSMGCVVADADANIKTVLKEDAVSEQLVSWWGDRVLDTNGQIDRSKVAQIVFQDATERRRLESLLHPLARALQEQQFASAPEGTIALVIDAPLLIEVGLDNFCDVILFVDCPRDIRMQRVLETRGWDAKELDRREATQIALDIKRKKADYVVINASERGMVHSQIEDVLADLETGQFKKN